jgi:cytochrome c-type biogenesis protein CcmH
VARAARTRPVEADAATAIYRDQSRQLDDDVAAGVVSADERERAHEEIVARLGDELAVPPAPAPAASPRAAWIAAIAIVALLPATALLAYLVLGNPQPSTRARPPARLRPEIVAMVEKLAERMKAQPDDPKGWLLLGRSMGALQRFRSPPTRTRRRPRGCRTTPTCSPTGPTRRRWRKGRTLAGKPTELIGRALAIDPRHPKALALAASAAMERRDDATAIRHWNALLATLPPDSEQARDVRETIAQLGGKAAAPPPIRTRRRVGPHERTRRRRACARVARAAASDAVRVRARGPGVAHAARRDPQESRRLAVTVCARRLDGDGARRDALVGREVVIEARVSASGTAAPTSGDLAGESGPVTPGASGIVVTINRIVP